jgi:hypothetical protein
MANNTVVLFDAATMKENLKACEDSYEGATRWDMVVSRLVMLAGKPRSADELVNGVCRALGISKPTAGKQLDAAVAAVFGSLLNAIAPSGETLSTANGWLQNVNPANYEADPLAYRQRKF